MTYALESNQYTTVFVSEEKCIRNTNYLSKSLIDNLFLHMPDDKFLLSEFRKAIRINSQAQVLDLDDKFKHKFDYYINRFEEVLRDTNRIIPPNRWSYYRIALIRQGSGDFVTGIYKFKATKNTLIVIPSRVITSSKNWTTDMKGYVVLFNIEFFLQNSFPHKYIEEKRILNSSIQPHIQLTDQDAEIIKDIFETLLSENESQDKNKEELIALKIIELLIVSERMFAAQQDFEENLPAIDIIQRFIGLLESHIMNERSVSFYAAQLNMHPNYLNSLIKKHTGFTAKESIQNRLLLESKYLLHSTKLTIKEISSQLGFNDPNYFTVFFKRLENISPVNYRTSFI